MSDICLGDAIAVSETLSLSIYGLNPEDHVYVYPLYISAL